MTKDFGKTGLRFDFLDDIFGDFLKGRGTSFSFSSFGGKPSRTKFQAWPGQEIKLDEILSYVRTTNAIHYELPIRPQEALEGVRKILKRRGKKMEVRIPAGVWTGSVVRLRNARQISDGLPGDIFIKVTIK